VDGVVADAMRGLLDPRDSDPATAVALADWLAFQQAFAWDPVRGRAALTRFGGPARALRALRVPPPSATWLEQARTQLASCRALVLPFGAAAFPERLATLSDAPPLLLVRGDPALLEAPAVALVGSRAASVYGLSVSRALSAFFARAGLVVVSGLARGIDAAAHLAALDAGGRTVAVQACGPERVYPPAHAALARHIADGGGALLTEFPPGTPPRAAHFPLRNRLISGLARAVVVVEARERSGSLVTAGHAAEQSREVFAVPGPLGVATSAGTNRLLRDGANVLLSADDVLQCLGIMPGAARPRARALANAEHHDGRVLRSRARGPATRDELARRLDAAPEALSLALLELELAGAIAEDRDGRLCIVGTHAFASL
jgi:DNA processing protein